MKIKYFDVIPRVMEFYYPDSGGHIRQRKTKFGRWLGNQLVFIALLIYVFFAIGYVIQVIVNIPIAVMKLFFTRWGE